MTYQLKLISSYVDPDDSHQLSQLLPTFVSFDHLAHAEQLVAELDANPGFSISIRAERLYELPTKESHP